MALFIGQNPIQNNTSQANYNASEDLNNAPKIIQKPVEKVSNVINTTVDTFIKEPEKEEDKKSYKKAIATGSTVLVLSALVALLNPKFSGKFVGKLKTLAHKAGTKQQAHSNSFLKTKLYGTTQKVLQKVTDVAQFTNTLNASKDVGFKWLCSAEKFKNVKNDKLKTFLQKCNSGFTKVMTKINNSVTNWFDNVSKSTVLRKNNSAMNKMKDLDQIVQVYKQKLSPSEQKLLDEKIKEIVQSKEFFSKNAVTARLANQEKAMSNLDHDFRDKLINGYIKKFKWGKKYGTSQENKTHNLKLIKDNLSYWAEDMMMPTRNQLDKEGKDAVIKLMGDGKNIKGQYQELFDILSPHLKKEEKAIINDALKSSKKKLLKAQHSECIDYFDKKRDLMLGGAPTDIITNSFMLGASGLAISSADTKEERISRALTLGFPAVAGIGTSIAMTAMLFSGVQGMLIGSATGAVMSKLGSIADKYLNPKKVDSEPQINKPNDNINPNKQPEVNYA